MAKKPEKDPQQTRSTLIEGVRDLTDTERWEEFDRLYRPMLTRYARDRGLKQDEIDEIVQECMIAIVERISNFEKRSSFRNWLRGMVEHKVADMFRRRPQELQALTRDFSGLNGREKTPIELWEREWNRAHLLHCMSMLRSEVAEHTWQAFHMYVIEEKSVEHIARVLGMTPNQVYVAKSRMMNRIEQRWEEISEQQ